MRTVYDRAIEDGLAAMLGALVDLREDIDTDFTRSPSAVRTWILQRLLVIMGDGVDVLQANAYEPQHSKAAAAIRIITATRTGRGSLPGPT